MGSRTGAEDEKKAVVMPSFDPQLPISNSVCVEGSTIHPYRATDFGVFLEDDAIDLSPGTVFISAKERTQAIPSNLLNSGAFDKKQSSTSVNIKSSAVQVESQRLPLQEVQQLNRVFIPGVSTENWGETQKLLLENIQQISIPIVNTENWGETNMADASPRTDISTDADTDDKNQRFDGGQSTALMASDSSDRSKDKMDQKTLRRLAQNREAARKSRLRKKVAKENEEVRSVCKEEGTVCEKNIPDFTYVQLSYLYWEENL
ncbi:TRANSCRIPTION FACTOR TGA2.3-LIKE ISOFORM X1 [Salix koriyanagi]|uniref:TRANSCRIPTION FACTOR TGA2.3-LIKE ISOFORM X1 n=1 Tax=Salix koriyanagi TaxID=2511006 RepID=A0A9Q0T6G0_9ROSI|nr:TRANSCRIPTION FACTOR TGA2.3-LIKE ISOFORM X1 [Salix koriyanagi]